GQALHIVLGPSSTTMSGKWTASFNLASPGTVTLAFAYRMDLLGGFESDEFIRTFYSIDGDDQTIATLNGPNNNGNGSTGWQTASITLNNLAAGSHTLELAAYLNGSS